MCKCCDRGGFPADDEYSVQQGDLNGGCACLDLFYPHQFVQNEECANTKSGSICNYKLEGYSDLHGPILPSTVAGTIYYDQVPLYTFFDKNGELALTEIDHKEKYPDREFPSVTGTIDYINNTIVLTWSPFIDNGLYWKTIPAGKSCIVVSYEFNLECQQAEPKCVKCPKCNHEFYDVPAIDDAITLQKLAEGGTLDMY